MDTQNVSLEVTPTTAEAPTPKKRGWPKGKKRGPRKPKAQVEG